MVYRCSQRIWFNKTVYRKKLIKLKIKNKIFTKYLKTNKIKNEHILKCFYLKCFKNLTNLVKYFRLMPS